MNENKQQELKRANLERFRALLQKEALPERFKVNRYVEDVPELLKECYIDDVRRRYRNYDEDQYTQGHIEKAAKWLIGDFKFGLLCYGGVGNGKTTLSRAIGRLIGIMYGSIYTCDRKSLRFVSALQLTELAKDSPERFRTLKNCELLAIDDVGIEPSIVKVWGNEVSPFVETMYHRYDKQLFTIMTSNLNDEELAKKYGERIADRFAEMFDRIPFENRSYRLK